MFKGNYNFFFIFIMIILLNGHVIKSQNLNDKKDIFDVHSAERGTFSFTTDAATFFHNNEFFETFVEGYTLTGAYLQPKIQYHINERFTAGAGIHMMKFNGKENFDDIRPWFNLQYKFSENFALTMGSFNGGESFLLPEPLYDLENNFINILNNGVRLDLSNSIITSVTWLNWETFIEPADTFQEEFTFGNSSILELSGNEEYELKLPLHLLFHHKGGQINQTDEPVITNMELAGGLHFKAYTGYPAIRSVTIEALGFYDKPLEGEKDGFGFYPRIFLENKFMKVSSGFYYGKYFQSEMGEPLFFNNMSDERGNTSDRRLFTFKADFRKQLAENSYLSLRFDGYYDVEIQKLQYSYGLYIVMNEWYKLSSW